MTDDYDQLEISIRRAHAADSHADLRAWERLSARIDAEAAADIERERLRAERRGQLVEILGDIAIVATLAGAGLVALWCAILALWRWL